MPESKQNEQFLGDSSLKAIRLREQLQLFLTDLPPDQLKARELLQQALGSVEKLVQSLQQEECKHR